MPKTAIKIGPADNGRRMSLEDFEFAEGVPGHLYELSRGVVTVMDVPNRRHLAQVNALRQELYDYRATHRDQIHTIAAGSDCKVLLADLDSERHPDLAVYKTTPPDDDDLWATWIPDILAEIVSPGSEQRDYVEKREEYLSFGVREYWIIDANRGEMVVLRRSKGRWVERVLRPGDVYRTRLLPGFKLAVSLIFEAAGQAGE